MADVGGGAVAVVRHGGDDDSHAARRVALVGDLLVVDVALLTCRLGDGALDILIGHVAGLRLGDDVAQLAVGGRVAAAVAHGNGDLTADFGEDFAALRVGLALLMLDICPFGMA